MTTVSTTLGVLLVLVEATGDDEGTSGQAQVICMYFHHLFNVDITSLQRVGPFDAVAQSLPSIL